MKRGEDEFELGSTPPVSLNVARGSVSRRDFMRFASLATGGAVFLAACGSSTSKSTVASSSSSAAPNSTSGLSTSDLSLIHSIYGPGGKAAGQGLTLNVGAALFLSGPDQFYGTVMSNSMKLAAEQIKAAGGPTINFTYRDIKSGSAVAGADDATAFGQAGLGVALTSNGFDGASMIPGLMRYKIFTLDGGGGTGPKAAGNQGKPYIWGTSANAPTASWPGMLKWLTQAKPNVKTIYLASWEEGPLSQIALNLLHEYMKPYPQLKHVGSDFFPIGTTNYSNIFAKIKAASPDMILLVAYGNDPGVFMKQYVTSGIKSMVMGSEYTSDAAKIAGAAYNGYYFNFQYFDNKNPKSDWAKFYIDQYEKRYGSLPDYWSANYFDNTYALWKLTREVLVKHGDPNKGPDMESAMITNPTFPSVYGGNGSTVGHYALSPTTHTLTEATLTVGEIVNQKVVELASFSLHGSNFKLLS